MLLACLTTPTVRDVAADWLSDAACCADDCDETGDACTQQCGHCITGHNVTVPATERGRATLAHWLTSVPPVERSGARSGHLDPPFRPPVS